MIPEENQSDATLLEQRVAALETKLEKTRKQAGAALGIASGAFGFVLVLLLSS